MSINVEGRVITVTGAIDGPGADSIVEAMAEDKSYILDIDKADDINFAGQRSLLRAKQGGKKFSVINACDRIAEKMEDSGVTSFITLSRKPKELNLSSFEEFGAGFMSKAFNSEDGDSVLKVYGSRVPPIIAAREKMIARAVMIFGIPTPLVGSLYRDGDNNGIDFERIEGKRSFSRIISEEPDRLEEITIRFAGMCKQLHSTECDTTIFPDRISFYRDSVARCKDLTEDEKKRVDAFIESIPKATTCLHGDMQLSNVITNGKDDLWIDLSDFSYGDPMLDMGMWYFLSKLNSEKMSQHIFHLGLKIMARIWDIFVEEYFGADTEEKKMEVEKRVQPFAALHMIHLGTNYGFEGNMVQYIKEQFK